MPDAVVYQILNRINGKRYVGSTVNLRHRWGNHRSALRRNNHYNAHLQAAWNLYGGKAFAFAVLEYVIDLERLIEREQHYMDALCPEYNIAPVAGSALGVKHTEETKQKMSAASTGRWHSEETKQKMSEAHRGERSSSAKLTEQDVREIRVLLQGSGLTRREIAARYGISLAMITKIKHGYAWTHISIDAPTGQHPAQRCSPGGEPYCQN